MRSPIDTSTSPSSSFSSARSICASLFPPMLTKATSCPNATRMPSTVWPRSNRRALTDASNMVAKSSSCSLTAAPSDRPPSPDYKRRASTAVLRSNVGGDSSGRSDAAGAHHESVPGMADEQDDLLGTIPSTLDLERSASAMRTGRRKMNSLQQELTHTDTRISGGDVDADTQSAYSVGDEAPGGDNPTPDQDVVQEIGAAVGLNYQDTEELGSERKLEERDRHRWELDPASAEDYPDRQRE